MNEESYLTHFTVSLRSNVEVSRGILAGAQIVCMLQQCCMHMALCPAGSGGKNSVVSSATLQS